MTDPWQSADEQAQRLAPKGIAPEFLREAIWLRTVAGEGPPTDAEVSAYLLRCQRLGEPVSGRPEHVPLVRPRELYRLPSGAPIVLRYESVADTLGRARWVAVWATTGEEITDARSRARIRRTLEEAYPGGEWSYSLPLRDRAKVRERWGLE